MSPESHPINTIRTIFPVIILILLSLCTLPGGTDAGQDRFITLPWAITRTGAAELDGQIYVFGGLCSGNISDSISMIDPVPGSVAELDTTLPHPIDNPTVFTDGRKAFIVGGKPIRIDPKPGCVDVQNMNLTVFSADGSLEHHRDFFPYGIEGASAAFDGTYFYLVGACMCSSAPGKSSVIRFDPDALSMEIYGEVLPHNVSGSTAVWHGGAVYIFGGKTDGGGVLDTVVRYVPGGDGEILPAHLPEPLYKTGAVLFDGEIYIIGGENPQGPTDRITVFDPTTGAIRDSGLRLMYPRASRAVIASEFGAYVIGGDTSDGPSDSIEAVRLGSDPGRDGDQEDTAFLSGNTILLLSVLGSFIIITIVIVIYLRDYRRWRLQGRDEHGPEDGEMNNGAGGDGGKGSDDAGKSDREDVMTIDHL